MKDKENMDMSFYYSKDEREFPLSQYKIIRSPIINKGAFNDSNGVDTVKPGTLLGYTDKNGHWYFEDIKYTHLAQFLDQNNIHWNLMARTGLETLFMPRNVAEIARNQNKYELFLSYEGFQDFFNYQIDEWHFILKNEENDIIINLSKEWNKFLEEFKQENQVDHPLNI